MCAKERKGIAMKSLYACIEINRKVNEIESMVTERVRYYKTKDELYGIEVIKDNNLPNKEEKINDIAQITEDEKEIDTILDTLVSDGVMYNFEDIINDLIRNRLCSEV